VSIAVVPPQSVISFEEILEEPVVKWRDVVLTVNEFGRMRTYQFWTREYVSHLQHRLSGF
jgi:hypothetical protein